MIRHKNKELTENSKHLRKNMTSEERKLWYKFLKHLPVTVNRQKVFDFYIVDFYCAKYKLVIEIDGSQHFEENGIKKDQKRDEYFKRLGITVIRYSNYDINYCFDDVCQDIINHMASPWGEAGSQRLTDEGK